MASSSIEWTEMTWNPTTGCTKISAGCKNCYAEVMSKRLLAMGISKYANGFKLTLHEKALEIPYAWKSPKIVFVNSMSDLFHKNVPLDFIKRVFQVMNDNPQHVFQVLTKRSDILLTYHKELKWTHNIWMGVSIENERAMHRIDDLRKTKAKVKFLSCEPLIGPLAKLNLNRIDWVIVGGESGRTPRPMEPQWVLDIQDQCKKSNVSFFFKQWGGTNKKKNGSLIDGKKYFEFPPQYYQHMEEIEALGY
jgi:protein gp37